jgi:hypothetical protein
VRGDVLDLCCGERLVIEAIMRALLGAGLLAYDGSKTMLAETRRRLSGSSRLTTKRIDLASDDWRNFEPASERLSLRSMFITSMVMRNVSYLPIFELRFRRAAFLCLPI